MKRALLALALAAALAGAPVSAQVATPPPPPPEPRGWIGISYETEKVQEGLRVRPVSRVVAVREGGPAQGAGVRVGDVLVSVNGRSWEEQFSKGAPLIRVGDPVQLVVERGGQRRDVRLVAGRWPEKEAQELALKVTMMPDSVVDRLYLAMDSLRVRIVEDAGLRSRIGDLQVAADSVMDALARERVVLLRRASPGQSGGVTRWALPGPVAAPGAPLTESPAPFGVWLLADSLRDSLTVLTESGIPFVWSMAGESAAPRVEFRPTVPYVLGETRVAGAEVVDLRPELAGYFGVPGGVLVVDVTEGTPAARAGILPGDVITHLAGAAVASISELRRGLAASRDTAPVTLIRKGQTLQVKLGR